MGCHVIFTCFLVGIMLIGVYWGSITHIEIATHAKGKVVPTGKIRTIQNLEGGIISSINVKEGRKNRRWEDVA